MFILVLRDLCFPLNVKFILHFSRCLGLGGLHVSSYMLVCTTIYFQECKTVYFHRHMCAQECLFPATSVCAGVFISEKSELCIESKCSQQHMFSAVKQGRADNSYSSGTLLTSAVAICKGFSNVAEEYFVIKYFSNKVSMNCVT